MKRKKSLLGLCGLLLMASLAAAAHATAQPQHPPGVPPHNWRDLGNGVGIVLYPSGNGLSRGMLMARVGGRWQPVALLDDFRLGPNVVPAED